MRFDQRFVAPEDIGEKGVEPRLVVKRLILLLGKDGAAALGVLSAIQQLLEREPHQMANLQQGIERQGGLVHHPFHGRDGDAHRLRQRLIADSLVGQGLLQCVENIVG